MRKQKSIHFKDDTMSQIKVEADKKQLSITAYIRMVMIEHLDHLKVEVK